MLKNVAIENIVLAYPNALDPFILDTDASDFAVGSALIQVQNGQETPMAFASKTLIPTQHNYCTTRRELLAVVVFTRQFRHYLLGRHFVVRTDHHSLIWSIRFKNPEGQLIRWLEELSQYDLSVVHRAGKHHCNVDGLSRIGDALVPCTFYQTCIDLADLPCGGCPYCRRAHSQWQQFEVEIDDVIPLTLKSVRRVTSDCSVSGWRYQTPWSDYLHQWIETMRDTVNRSPCSAADIDVDDDLTRSAPWTEVMRLSSNQNMTVHPPKLEEERIMCPNDHQISLAPRPGIPGEMLTEQETGFMVILENGGGGGNHASDSRNGGARNEYYSRKWGSRHNVPRRTPWGSDSTVWPFRCQPSRYP